MCFGGGSQQSSVPAQAASVQSKTPEFAATAYEEEKGSEVASKKRKGKRGLRVPLTQDSANVASNSSGLNIPTK